MRKLPKAKHLIDGFLLEGILKSDSETIDYIYKNYLPVVSKYICNNGGNHDDARDVFQEALLVLFNKNNEEQFELRASIKTIIFSICRFQWLKILRSKKRVELMKEGFDLEDLNKNIFSNLEKKERFILLHSHVRKFKGNHKKIMELHFQKYSTLEISESLNLSRLYVKKKKFECKKQLIASIKKDVRYKELVAFF